MRQSLPVSCQLVSFDANDMHGWTIFLRQTWVAGTDYPAGAMGMTCDTLPDGQYDRCAFGDAKSSLSYPHVGKSKHKG